MWPTAAPLATAWPRSPSMSKRRPMRAWARFVHASTPSGRQTLTVTSARLCRSSSVSRAEVWRVTCTCPPPDELAAQHAVDVLGDAGAAVGDRLVGDCPCQGGAEQDPAHRDDARAREQEDAQQRDRTLGRRPQVGTGSGQQFHGSNPVSDRQRKGLSRATLDSQPHGSRPRLLRHLGLGSDGPARPVGAPRAPRRRAAAVRLRRGHAAAAAALRRSAWSSCGRSSSRTSTPTTTSACRGC